MSINKLADKTAGELGIAMRSEKWAILRDALFRAAEEARAEAAQQSVERTPAEVDEQVLDWIVENNLGGE